MLGLADEDAVLKLFTQFLLFSSQFLYCYYVGITLMLLLHCYYTVIMLYYTVVTLLQAYIREMFKIVKIKKGFLGNALHVYRVFFALMY